MDRIKIENQWFFAEIAPRGAELKCLQSKKSGWNYLWDGNGTWKRSSPILFPNIGGLAGETYLHQGREYPAPPHGFARDMDFTLEQKTADAAVFALKSSGETGRYFPFRFALTITYRLGRDGVSVTWRVENQDTQTMYFSIGAHPGFRLLPGTGLSDYSLYFDRPIPIETRRVVGRYLTREKELLSGPCDVFPLSARVMERDAIILEDTGLRRITLRAPARQYGLWIDFPDFPVAAVWTDPHAAAQAAFLCLEPWCGINALCGDEKADISRKARITELAGGRIFERAYQIGIEE